MVAEFERRVTAVKRLRGQELKRIGASDLLETRGKGRGRKTKRIIHRRIGYGDLASGIPELYSEGQRNPRPVCDGSNKKIALFILVRDASHIHTIAMLKEDDERLKGGIRLRHLRDFRRVAHGMSRIS